MAVPVVALYGALNAFINVGLALAVSRVRGTQKVSLGHGDSSVVLKAMRAYESACGWTWPQPKVLEALASL